MESAGGALDARGFGKYTLVAKLATGGAAEILLARLSGAAGFEKHVCIKRILPHLAEDEAFVAMFLDEARIASQISHPNVCQVFELGEIDGDYFIAMEYLEGVPMACFRRTDLCAVAPDPTIVVGLAVQACEGLHHAHELRHTDGNLMEVVHRDVSPQNLFVTKDGTLKVLDFGIAKIRDPKVRTTTGVMKGTYGYMAPEQLRGESLDRRTDVFAMGIVVWETLAQRHLFRKDTDYQTFRAIADDPIPSIEEFRPDVPPALADAITRALARDREQRFPTARAFGEALVRSVQPLGGPAAASTISELVLTTFAPVLAEQRALIKGGRTLETSAASRYQSLLATPLPRRRPSTPPGPTPALLSAPEPPSVPLLEQPPPRGRRWMLTAAIGIAGAAGGLYALRTAPERTPAIAGGEHAAEPANPVAKVETGTGGGPTEAQIAIPPTADAPSHVNTTAIDGFSSSRSETRSRRARPKIPGATTPPEGGFLTIDSTPVYSTIYVDGQAYGDTPLIRVQLPAGKHTVRAVTSTGQQRDVRIIIEPGKLAVHRVEW